MNNKKTSNNTEILKRSAIAIAVALTLNACSSSDGASEVTANSFDGNVVDGYIGGAIVCFDTDNDLSCTGEEYQTTTEADGSYKISAPAGTDQLYPLVAEIPVGAIDSERGTVSKAVTYSSPIGETEVLTPLTTLVHHEILKNPTISAEDAEIIVKGQLSIDDDTVSLLKDPITEKENNEAYKDLHLKAELINDYLGNISSQIDDLDTENTFDTLALLQLAVAQLQTQLSSLIGNLETKIAAPEFDIDNDRYDDFKGDFEQEFEDEHSDDDDLNFDDLKSKLDDIELTSQATTADIKAALKAGIYSFWGDGYEFIRLNAAETQLTFNEYYFNGTDWEPSTSDDMDICLGNNGWETTADAEPQNITFNADNTLTVTDVNSTCPGETIKAAEISLDGKSWSALIDDLPTELDSLFMAGAKGFQVMFKLTANDYWVGSWDQDTCWVNGSLAQSSASLASLNGNCNVVASAAGNGSAATTFNEVLFSSQDTLSDEQYSVHLNSTNDIERVVRIFGEPDATTGTATIRSRTFNTGTTSNNWMTEATINWGIKTVNSEQIMHFSDIPKVLLEELGNYDDNEQPILAVQNGFVRQGSVELADGAFHSDGDLTLNSTAFEQLKAAAAQFEFESDN